MTVSASPILDAEISIGEASDLCDVGPRRLQQLVTEGRISKATRGRYRLRDVVRGYVLSLRDDVQRASRNDAANRVADARARQIELRTAREDGRLIELAEHNAIFDEMIATIKLGFGALPLRVTNDLSLRDQIEDEIRMIFTDVAAKFAARAAELRAAGKTQRKGDRT